MSIWSQIMFTLVVSLFYSVMPKLETNIEWMADYKNNEKKNELLTHRKRSKLSSTETVKKTCFISFFTLRRKGHRAIGNINWYFIIPRSKPVSYYMQIPWGFLGCLFFFRKAIQRKYKHPCAPFYDTWEYCLSVLIKK